jgi:hypothetical protein
MHPLSVLILTDNYRHQCLGRRLLAAFPHDGYSMAADPDHFEDDCRPDDGILSGDAGDDSDDPEEVQSLLTTIQRTRTRAEQRPVGSNEPATVSFCL